MSTVQIESTVIVESSYCKCENDLFLQFGDSQSYRSRHENTLANQSKRMYYPNYFIISYLIVFQYVYPGFYLQLQRRRICREVGSIDCSNKKKNKLLRWYLFCSYNQVRLIRHFSNTKLPLSGLFGGKIVLRDHILSYQFTRSRFAIFYPQKGLGWKKLHY